MASILYLILIAFLLSMSTGLVTAAQYPTYGTISTTRGLSTSRGSTRTISKTTFNSSTKTTTKSNTKTRTTTTTTTTTAPTSTTTSCAYPKILNALQRNYDNGSDIFCGYLLEKISLVGTLREDPTYFFYATVTDSSSTDVVYKYKATTITTTATSTSYASQTRTARNFTAPLPSYVHQFPTASVSSACSCYVGEGRTYTQYRVCEQATTTTSFSTTFTYTVGVPGPSTSTYTETFTKTNFKYTTAPFPRTCPDADGIDYIATDSSVWERGCQTGLNCYRELATVKAGGLTPCIEKCVDWNQKEGYKQCQAVSYLPKTDECLLINEPCYFAHPDGNANIATLKFVTPSPTYSNYCATVSGADPWD